MWVIYHGYKATSAPLMAAILHRYFYPSIVGSDKKEALPICDSKECFEKHVYHRWKQALSDCYVGGLTRFGSDSYGNQVYVLERKRFFAILKRTILTAMELTGNWEQVIFVDTSDCTNLRLELGIWFRQLTCQVLGVSGPDKDRNHTTWFCLGICTLGETLIQHGLKRILPRLLDLIQGLEQKIC
jgi:hypothetical protein